LSGDLSRKLLLRAAKARLGKRAYAQRLKEKQELLTAVPVDSTSDNEASVGAAILDKNNEEDSVSSSNDTSDRDASETMADPNDNSSKIYWKTNAPTTSTNTIIPDISQPITTSSNTTNNTTEVFPRVHAYRNAKKNKCKSKQILEDTSTPTTTPLQQPNSDSSGLTTLEPYICKLERFEFFSTLQAYYIVACDKQNQHYRLLRMDRTRMERSANNSNNNNNNNTRTEASFYGAPSRARNPASADNVTTGRDNGSSTILEQTSSEVDSINAEKSKSPSKATGSSSTTTTTTAGQAQNTLQIPLADFCSEDTHTYTQLEIQDQASASEFFEVYNGVVNDFHAIVDEFTSGPALVLELRAEEAVLSF